MAEWKPSKTIYVNKNDDSSHSDPKTFEEDITDGVHQDGDVIAVYELKSVKKLKLSPTLV